MSKKILILCLWSIISLLSYSVNAATLPPRDKVRTVTTEHFHIHYPEHLSLIAEDMVHITEKVHDQLSQTFKWSPGPGSKTHILLADNQDISNGGATVHPNNYMVLWIYPPDGDTSLDYYQNYLEMLFTHEYTHILHMDQNHGLASVMRFFFGRSFLPLLLGIPNGVSPGWIREGLASWQESTDGYGRANFSYVEMLIRLDILEKNFPKIDEVSTARIKFPGGNAKYYHGVMFIQWLADSYGEDKVIEYVTKYGSNVWPFSASLKAKKVFGKSFYTLWDEWRESLEKKYADEIKLIEKEGISPFNEKFAKENTIYSYPITFHDKVGYFANSLDTGIEILNYRKLRPDEEKSENDDQEKMLRMPAVGQSSYSLDKEYFAYSGKSMKVQPYHTYNDVYVYDTINKRRHRVGYSSDEKAKTRKSFRAKDPEFSPDNGGNRWLLMVRSQLATDNLYLYDLGKKPCWHVIDGKKVKTENCSPKGTYLTNEPRYTQFSNPRFSPNGKLIAVSRQEHNGHRDLVLYSKDGKFISKITDDRALDNYPVWAKNGKSIYYISDRTGISNLYRYDLKNQTITRLTNVKGGIYQPAFTDDEKKLYVQYFTSTGGKIYELDTSHFKNYETFSAAIISSNRHKRAKNLSSSEGNQLVLPFSPEPSKPYEQLVQVENEPQYDQPHVKGSKKYNAFPHVIRPRFLAPEFSIQDDVFLIAAGTSNYDPLYRHSWGASANYRSDADFVGFNASYSYKRYLPEFHLNVNRYVLNWGRLSSTNTSDFFEKRLRGSIGFTIAPQASKTSKPNHFFGLSYFFEDRSNQSSVSGIASSRLVNLDNYAGLYLSYTFQDIKKNNYSISSFGKKPFFRTTLSVTDGLLGSAEANEQMIWTGDLRHYFKLPWHQHHVFAVRGTGGYVFGDQEELVAGSLRFGGPWSGIGSSKVIPFRGLPGITYAGDRAMLLSAEYRLPLSNVERGIGTWPIFLQKLHLAAFTDFGDIWVRNAKDNDGRNFFEDFLWSVGLELRGDFNLFYGVPLDTRLGYGIIIRNRDQVAGLKDGNLDMDVTSGNFYFQIGTSF